MTLNVNEAIFFNNTGLKQRMTYTGDNIIYLGQAKPGKAEDANAWQILKMTYDGDNITDVDFANSDNEFVYKWSLRTTYTYG